MAPITTRRFGVSVKKLASKENAAPGRSRSIKRSSDTDQENAEPGTKRTRAVLSSQENQSSQPLGNANAKLNAKATRAPVVRTNRATTLRNRKASNEGGYVTCSQSSSCSSQESNPASVAVKEPAKPHPTHLPKVRVFPAGVEDFDARPDYFGASTYVADNFDYLHSRQSKFAVRPYMETQKTLNPHMRAILVDWMVELQESFELIHETLYLAVRILDMYLSKRQATKQNFQLIGAASLFLAAKYEERVVSAPLLDDIKYCCEDAFSANQIKAMEREVFRTVGFELGMPISYTFLRRYARTAGLPARELTLARYILETSLLDYTTSVTIREDVKAGGAAFLARRMLGQEGWTPALEHYSGLKADEVKPVAIALSALLTPPSTTSKSSKTKNVRQKYSHDVFLAVATIPLIETSSI